MTRFFFALTTLAILCTGCFPAANLYQVPPPNIPLPFNKGETKINTYLSTLGYGLQVSTAIDSHFVMMLNANGQNTTYNRWYPANDDPGLSTTVSNLQLDIGGGYYKQWDTTGRFEIIGGIGYGNSGYNDASPGYSTFSYNVTNASGQFVHLLLQTDVGWVGKHAELAAGCRLSNLIAGTDFQFTYADYNNTKQKYIFKETADALFFEPYLTFALGFKNVKLIASVSPSLKIFGPDINLPYGSPYGGQTITESLYQNLDLSIGVLFNFNRDDIKRKQ